MNRRWETVLAVALIGAAILLRTLVFLDNRSFWGDEVMIALNVRARGFLGLLTPLELEQTMPIPLLFLTRLLTLVLGHHEMVYRLPMFLAGCALPFEIWRWYPARVGRVEAFATRRLVERILSRLKSAGARVEQPVTLGQSALYRVTLP